MELMKAVDGGGINHESHTNIHNHVNVLFGWCHIEVSMVLQKLSQTVNQVEHLIQDHPRSGKLMQ